MYLLFRQQTMNHVPGGLYLACAFEHMEDVIAYVKCLKENEAIIYKLHDSDRVTTVYTEQKITFQDGDVETENGEYHV